MRYRTEIRAKIATRTPGRLGLYIGILICNLIVPVSGRGEPSADPKAEQVPQTTNVFEIAAQALMHRRLTMSVIPLFRDGH